MKVCTLRFVGNRIAESPTVGDVIRFEYYPNEEALPLAEPLPQGEDGVLYLTDSAQVAERLMAKGLPVVGYDPDLTGTVPNTLYVCQSLAALTPEEWEEYYCRLNDLPMEVLCTKRILVRECCPEDIPALMQVYDDDEIRRFLEPLYLEKEEREYAKKYMRNVYALYGYGMWVLCDREDGRVVGRAGVEKAENPIRKDDIGVELGFLLEAGLRRQGIMTEVLTAILDYVRAYIDEPIVFAVVRKENAASHALLSSLGFEMRGEFLKDGYSCDYLEYAIDRKE